MVYFKSTDIAAIALCAALWGVLNAVLSPIFFSIFHLPFLCDLIGFTILSVAAWWIRKFGAIIIIGIIATAINFILVPNPYHFIGFTAASVFFDLAIAAFGYNRSFSKKAYMIVIMMAVSILSAALAGYIIGVFFMAGSALASVGGAIGWSGLHTIGGVIGGALGTFLIIALTARKIVPHGQKAPNK